MMYVAAIVLGLSIYFLLLRPVTPHHTSSSVRFALLILLAIVMSTSSSHVPTPPPRDPDERKKQVTPPNGTPIVCAPDAGTHDDGGSTMLATDPDTRTANAAMAIDYAATPEFVIGEPRSEQPR